MEARKASQREAVLPNVGCCGLDGEAASPLKPSLDGVMSVFTQVVKTGPGSDEKTAVTVKPSFVPEPVGTVVPQARIMPLLSLPALELQWGSWSPPPWCSLRARHSEFSSVSCLVTPRLNGSHLL